MKWLIWSNQHGMWWRPEERGYTQVIEEAGRYDRADAERIVANATVDGRLQRSRIDPYTGVEYMSLDEEAVLTPEAVQQLLAEAEKLRAENARLERLQAEPFPTSDGYESAMQALADERARVAELETVLGEVLRSFYDKGHPGFEAYRSNWVKVESLEKWRRIAAASGAGS